MPARFFARPRVSGTHKEDLHLRTVHRGSESASLRWASRLTRFWDLQILTDLPSEYVVDLSVSGH